MGKLGNTDEVRGILEKSGIASAVFSEVEPDPPVEEIEKIAKLYQDEQCDGLIALGGGSSMDAAKAAAIKVSQPGPLNRIRSRDGRGRENKASVTSLYLYPHYVGYRK